MIDVCLVGPLRGLAAAFTETICSWHIQARKPEAAAFMRAAERLGCSPGRLLLLDDSADTVEAARRCGWAAERVANLDDVVAAIGRPCLQS